MWANDMKICLISIEIFSVYFSSGKFPGALGVILKSQYLMPHQQNGIVLCRFMDNTSKSPSSRNGFSMCENLIRKITFLPFHFNSISCSFFLRGEIWKFSRRNHHPKCWKMWKIKFYVSLFTSRAHFSHTFLQNFSPATTYFFWVGRVGCLIIFFHVLEHFFFLNITSALKEFSTYPAVYIPRRWYRLIINLLPYMYRFLRQIVAYIYRQSYHRYLQFVARK